MSYSATEFTDEPATATATGRPPVEQGPSPHDGNGELEAAFAALEAARLSSSGTEREDTPMAAAAPGIDAAASAVADAVARSVSGAVAGAVADAMKAAVAGALGTVQPGAASTSRAASEPVESQASPPPTLETAPATSNGQAPTPPARLLVAYARYLAIFVGAGLMAGAAVHFPLAPLRYTAMGAVGAVLFAAGSIGEGFADRSTKGRVTYVAASLLVALAVGMVAGGIQHFEDVPGRAAVLIPFGLVLGLGAFMVRDGLRLAKQHVLPLFAGALVLSGAVGFGLDGLASGAGAGAGASGGGHHGETTDAGGEAPGAAEAPSPAAGGDAHGAPAATPASATAKPATPAAAAQAPAAHGAAAPAEAASSGSSRYAAPAHGATEKAAAPAEAADPAPAEPAAATSRYASPNADAAH